MTKAYRLAGVLAVVGIVAASSNPRAVGQVRAREPQPLSRVVDYEPAWSPDAHSLAFVSNRNGFFKIYTMQADGTGLRQLTQGPDEDDAPAWSPDGGRIAYVSKQDGNEEIYVMQADGSAPTRLTRHPAADIHPAWSPDGTLIMWNSSRNSRSQTEPDVFEIFTMRADGSELRQLTHGGVATYASWSPDGAQIVFRKQLEGNNSDVFVMRADGSGLRNVTRHPAFDGWPSWSRDGTRIVFAREEGDDARIYSVGVSGSTPNVLVQLAGRCTNPRWSPKGDRIVFSRRWERQIRLYVVDLEFSEADGESPPKKWLPYPLIHHFDGRPGASH